MIDISATKGYGYIKIEIFHNNKNIDFDSIEEIFKENMKELQSREKEIIKEIKN